jgi:hypothetical protein
VGILLLAGAVVFFFAKAIRSNWAEVQAHQFRFHYPFVALSFVAVTASCLLSTIAWQVTINSLSEDKKMSFARSIATVNTTSLTKYLPGKFWSYALQMYWLVGHGFAKSLVLYANLINLVVSMLTGVMLALGFLLFTNRFPTSVTAAALALLCAGDFVCIAFHGKVFQLGGALIRRLFKRELGTYDVSLGTMLRLQAIHLLGQLVSAIGAYLLCFGIGYELAPREVLLVMSSLILADAAGFVAFLVPGGIGVREGTMYLLLGGAAAGSLAVVLPVASRMVYLIVDGLLGALALKLLRSFMNSAQAEPSNGQ